MRLSVGQSVQMQQQVAQIELRLRLRQSGCFHGADIHLESVARRYLHRRPRSASAKVFAYLLFQCSVVGLESIAESVLKRRAFCQQCQKLDELTAPFSLCPQYEIVNHCPRLGVEHPLLGFFVVLRRLLLHLQKALNRNKLWTRIQRNEMLLRRTADRELVLLSAKLERAVALRQTFANP